MRIDQFVHTLQYGDAISGEALALKRILQNEGFESEIYYVHAHELVKKEGREYSGYQSTGTRDEAVILHYSIASPLNDLFLELDKSFRLAVYHNLTPERWFLSYNYRVVQDLIRAREQLREVVQSADIVLCDSTYNQQEVLEFTPRSSAVFPLVLDAAKWSIEANAGIARAVKGHGGKNLLSVGRIAPNKCLEDVLKIFYFYHHKYDTSSRLWIVGSDTDTEIYRFELGRLAQHLRLSHAVSFVGAVADSELKSFYENSDLYLCMSEHEGFCVPLIEAMHFGLPIVAFDSCAVKETLGGSGLLAKEKKHHEIAGQCATIIRDAALRERMIAKQREQLGRFALASFAAQVRTQIIEPVTSWMQHKSEKQALAR